MKLPKDTEVMISERGEKYMRKKRTVFVIMVFILLQTVFIIPSLAEDSPREKDPAIAVLFTNDVHCYYDRDIGYDGLVLYAKELEQEYEHVILVDAGDAIQERRSARSRREKNSSVS